MRAATVVASVLVLVPPLAGAQPRRFAEEPTSGLALPAPALAGEHDATSVDLNPAGLTFLGGSHLELVVSAFQPDRVEASGAGLGVYAAAPLALPFLPRLGFGVAAERLLPPRVAVVPDPGEPMRLSVAMAYSQWKDLSFGASWHHFVDEEGGALDGLDTFDAGLAVRWGAHWAFGMVARDLLAPRVAEVPVQRRYDMELVSRPLGHDRLEVGLGLEVGERRHEVDPRLRVSLRIAGGAWIRGDVEARTLWELDDPAFAAGDATRDYDVRGTLGLEVSFGELGIAGFGTASWGGGDGLTGGGSTVVRWSGERLPSVLPAPERIERVRVEGGLSERALTALVLRLRRLERDPKVRGVFVLVDGVTVGWAGAQDLRDAIHRLRARGKKVFAYMIAGSTRDFYIAAAADRIYLDAAGGLRLQGMSTTLLFFKGLFDKLGVVAQFEKIDEYKSAPEAFTRVDSSDEAREMKTWLLDGVYDEIVDGIARDRGRTREDVRRLLDGGPYTAGEAAEVKLVDAVVEPADADKLIAKELGRYAVSEGSVRERTPTWEYPQIAVVYLDGDIVDGKSRTVPLLGMKLVGGETLAAALAWARANPRVHAVVLRVDSPGGSALASEMIAREVQKTKGVKPIIVSMGDIAASGGYFVAAPGDWIYAQPSTFTGSIGIFTGKFDLSELLSTMGLTWETTRRGAHADMDSYFRPYTDEERAGVKKKLGYYYDRFRSYVARGRGMTLDEVDQVGRGRVFTGTQAKERKLVDQYGGIADAIADAKRRAGFDDDDVVEVVMLPAEPQSLTAWLLRLMGGGGAEQAATAVGASEVLPGSLIDSPRTPQARLPFEIIVE